METAVVSLVCIALIVFGGMTMSRGFITSVDSTAMALDKMGQRDEKILRTELSPTDAHMHSFGTLLDVNLNNNGQTKLADFSKWDIIVQYYGVDHNSYVTWLPYTEGVLGNNQWQKTGIYLSSGMSEVFEPNILNPGENIWLRAMLSPAAHDNNVNLVVVSTPNGVPASINFQR